MTLPNINISFEKAAATAAFRSRRGVVAVIVKDATASVQGYHVFASAAQLPAAMTAVNKAYISRCFIGGDSTVSKVLCYVLPATATDLSAATAWLSTQKFNWLAGPYDCTAAESAELAAWITIQRAAGRRYKAVLPNKAADSMAIVNFATDGIVSGGVTYSAAGYCSRIAGLIAGTALDGAITFQPLPEVTAVNQLSRSQMDTAINEGKLIALHDGAKVKLGRGVTSLTTTAGTVEEYRKIKIVEAVDLISEDITSLAEDSYIGRYSNSYDNKLLLVTAIGNYFKILEGEGVLKAGSSVSLDFDATSLYLKNAGVDVAALSQRELREADTGDQVFLKASILVLDAVEDITLKISI